MEGEGADDVLGRIGNFGKYQLRVIGLVQFVGVFTAWQLLVSLIDIQYQKPVKMLSSSPVVSCYQRLTSGAVHQS